MERGSKYNPYECPECGYKTARKGNLKIHLERVHGLFPFLPEHSKEDWVYAQLHTLAKEHAKAEIASNKEAAHRFWDSLLSLYTYHRGLFPIEYIVETVAKEKNLKRRRHEVDRSTLTPLMLMQSNGASKSQLKDELERLTCDV